MNNSIFIFSGEQSADNHGSLLVKELKKQDENVFISAIGGKKIAEAGALIVRDNSDLAVVGLVEVLKHYNKFKALLDFTFNYIKDNKIDIVVLIDYPGFNLRLAKLLKTESCKVIYYISPQLWAWGKKRISIIQDCIDHIMVIFEFEKTFYQKHQIDSTYVGHPLIDTFDENINIVDLKHYLAFDKNATIIAMLPGSRKSEIERLLPVLIKTINILSNLNSEYMFVLSAASDERFSEIEQMLNLSIKDPEIRKKIKVVQDDINKVIKLSNLVIVASGTAAFQVALHQKLMIVIYKINTLSYYFFKCLIKIPFVSIVNIIANKMIVPELIQNKCNAQEISNLVVELLKKDSYKKQIIDDLNFFKERIGPKGASKNAASKILTFLNNKENNE